MKEAYRLKEAYQISTVDAPRIRVRRLPLAALLLSACAAAPSPAQRTAAYQRAIDVSKLACLSMLADAQATVTDEQKAQCLVVLRGCPK